MSLDFKLHYDRLREGDPTKPETAAVNEQGTFYEGPSHTRNLCLIWTDGKRQFLNYAYLIGEEFDPIDELSIVKLNFYILLQSKDIACKNFLCLYLTNYLGKLYK